jgi:NAD(P)H-hydrate epimerase
LDSLDYDISVDILQTLSAKNAAALDKDLMSIGAFSIDQLMELAGLSVSQAGLHSFPSNIFHFLKR